MSDKMKSVMWEYPAETAAERLIGLKMADISDDQGRSIYFSIGTYAKAALVTKRGARKIIARMKEWKIVLLDKDLAVQLVLKGKDVKGEVYRLNVARIREYILADEIARELFGDDPKAELSSSSGDDGEAHEAELSSASDGEADAELSSGKAELSSDIYSYKESIQTSPYSPPSEDYSSDFEKLLASWQPFEMTIGDVKQAERKYAKIRSEGIGAYQVLLAARVYCQQCRNTRCKTKHIENWLGQCVWKPEGKGLGEGSNGKSRDKKPPAADAEKPRALRHQPWHNVVKQQLGDAVYLAWIERLWLEGDIVYCPSKFAADYLLQNYSWAIIGAIGHDLRFVAESPPQHAFADFVEHPAGEDHGQDQITA